MRSMFGEHVYSLPECESHFFFDMIGLQILCEQQTMAAVVDEWKASGHACVETHAAPEQAVQHARHRQIGRSTDEVRIARSFLTAEDAGPVPVALSSSGGGRRTPSPTRMPAPPAVASPASADVTSPEQQRMLTQSHQRFSDKWKSSPSSTASSVAGSNVSQNGVVGSLGSLAGFSPKPASGPGGTHHQTRLRRASLSWTTLSVKSDKAPANEAVPVVADSNMDAAATAVGWMIPAVHNSDASIRSSSETVADSFAVGEARRR